MLSRLATVHRASYSVNGTQDTRNGAYNFVRIQFYLHNSEPSNN